MPHFLPFGPLAVRQPLHAPDDAIAHDKWSDFDDERIVLDAVIVDNNIAGSVPALQIRASDGASWTVELGRHSRNDAAGLTAAQALPGDRVTVIGRPAHRIGENRIKALHVTIGDRSFDLYPEAEAA